MKLSNLLLIAGPLSALLALLGPASNARAAASWQPVTAGALSAVNVIGTADAGWLTPEKEGPETPGPTSANSESGEVGECSTKDHPVCSVIGSDGPQPGVCTVTSANKECTVKGNTKICTAAQVCSVVTPGGTCSALAPGQCSASGNGVCSSGPGICTAAGGGFCSVAQGQGGLCSTFGPGGKCTVILPIGGQCSTLLPSGVVIPGNPCQG